MGPIKNKHDALVVGLGFGGLYSLDLLKKQGLDVVAVDSGADVKSHTYRSSFDEKKDENSSWPHSYLTQSELQIARKNNLYPLIQFNSELKAATWDDNHSVWQIKLNTGETFTVRYMVISIGIQHRPSTSNFAGSEKFTSLESVDGSYFSIDFKGRGGKSLQEHWREAPVTHMRLTISDFPNLFFINSPSAPFANSPPVCENSSERAAELISKAEKIHKKGLINCSPSHSINRRSVKSITQLLTYTLIQI